MARVLIGGVQFDVRPLRSANMERRSTSVPSESLLLPPLHRTGHHAETNEYAEALDLPTTLKTSSKSSENGQTSGSPSLVFPAGLPT